MKIILEILSLITGGLFGSLVGSHFKTERITPWRSRFMSILAAFVLVFGAIGEGYLKFGRTSFSVTFLLAFIIETLGQKEVSQILSKFFRRKVKEAIKNEEEK